MNLSNHIEHYDGTKTYVSMNGDILNDEKMTQMYPNWQTVAYIVYTDFEGKLSLGVQSLESARHTFKVDTNLDDREAVLKINELIESHVDPTEKIILALEKISDSMDSTFWGGIKSDIKEALISKGLSPTDDFSSYADLIESLSNEEDGIYKILTGTISDIVFPSGISEVRNYCFYYYPLNSIVFPEGVTKLGDYALCSCHDLSSVSLPSTLKSIGSYAFQQCRTLTSLSIPNSVSSIGANAFNSMYALTSMVLPSQITNIPTSAFTSCKALTSVTIPDGVTQINAYAFYNCEALPSVKLPSSLKTIENYAFRNCTSLTSITIPSSVTSIANYAFQGCTDLTEIVVNKAEGSISGESWGAPNAIINYNYTEE